MFLYIHPSTKVISDEAFHNNEELEGVDLCEGLERIGKCAFKDCVNLKRIKVPSTVKVIDERVFEGCVGLEEVELCKGLDHIGEGAFSRCKCLIRIKIPSTVKVIGELAFEDCERLGEVELCEGLERVDARAFVQCKCLKHIKIPDTVKVIGDRAFQDCERLEKAHLCDGLEKIGDCAFLQCERLKYIKIPSTVEVIGYFAFADCKVLEKVELCEGLERIGIGAFEGCGSLKRIYIPSTVNAIGMKAFGKCKRLERIRVPSAVTEIDEWLFEDCDNLMIVELNEGLQKIRSKAFFNCVSLRHIKVPPTVKVIGQRAFGSCQQLEVVELFEGLEEIEGGAFIKCESLRKIQFPPTVKVVGEGLFNGCQQLLSVELRGGIEQIDESAFQNCGSLRNIMIPITAQASKSFGRGCYDLQRLFDVKIEDALTRRFDGLPVHRICYQQSHSPTGVVIEQLMGVAGSQNGGSPNQDSLGMTPLHILACSTRQKLDLYQLVISNQPKSLITEDKWGWIPLFYAIWGNAPDEIILFMIEIQRATFPSFNVNWNKMAETVCRAGASPDIAQRLLGIQQTFFAEHSIDCQNLARDLTISCLVKSEYDFGDFSYFWGIMMGTIIGTSRTHQGLIQNLQEIERKFFPDTNETNWQLVCEEFVKPLKGWWHPEDPVTSSLTFQFLVKCSIPERLHRIGITKWQKRSHMQIQSKLNEISRGGIRAFIGSINSDIAYLPALIDDIHCTIVPCEQEYWSMKDATSLLELALWKSKIEELKDTEEPSEQREDQISALKRQCLYNCGADIIIPIVLPFLVDNFN